MISVSFERRSSAHGCWFTRQRIYWRGWRWTPFVRVSWRYRRAGQGLEQAMPVCPFCRYEMVRAHLQDADEGDWRVVWLCGCEPDGDIEERAAEMRG